MQDKLQQILSRGSEIILGKEEELRLALISILSNGHLLIEDVPGVGKTTLVHLLGKLFGLTISRIQFTNDMLPSDILGTSVFDKEIGDFSFKAGPIFGQLILADELNRATPKTQSALLQSMEERIVSIDGKEYELGFPFLIIATQNPFQQIGTFQLPESQLDRFFMSVNLKLPKRKFEKLIIQGGDNRELIKKMDAVASSEELKQWQEAILKVELSDPVLEYILDLLERGRSEYEEGILLSPRSGKDLALASKAEAFLNGRKFVLPEDVQFVAPSVLGHRIGGNRGVKSGANQIHQLLKLVAVS